MPKQQYENKKSKADAKDNNGGSNKKEINGPKEEKHKNNKEKTKSDMLLHNGDYGPNTTSWVIAMKSPEIYKDLDLKNPWGSSLFKYGTDTSKISRPTLIGGEPVIPMPKNALGLYDPDGEINAIEEKRYWKQIDKSDIRESEERLVYDLIQSKQSPQSISICKQDASYEAIDEKKDVVAYLKLIYKTHLISNQNPIQAELSSLKKFVTFRQFDNQSTLDYFEAFRRMMDQIKQSVPSSMIPSEELEAWALLMGMGAGHSQLKQTLMSDPSKIPKTVIEMQNKIISHHPLETISQKTRNASAFGTTGNPSNRGPKGGNNGGSNNGNQDREKKRPSKPCSHCTEHNPDYPDKMHWYSDCPNIKKLIAERYGHNVQSSNNNNNSGNSDANTQGQPQQNTSGNQQSRNTNIGLGLSRSNTSGGGRGPSGNSTASNNAIIASINYSSSLESYNNNTSAHKNQQILDPQSQVAIFNREDLVRNIRNTEYTLTLYGMGNGSLVVTQIAEHPVLGDVWFHPDAAINVWQMRATEVACNVELIKEFDVSFGCKVTKAFLATERNTGTQYRFNYTDNLYVLEEGRH